MSMYEIIEKPKTETKFKQSASVNADYIVLLEDNNGISAIKADYDINILGSTMYNWVVRACPVQPLLVSVNKQADLLSTIKPLLKNTEYTVVLFGDTPLITTSAINEILEFADKKRLSVCKLARGYVFKTEYIKNANAIYALTLYDICKNQLFQVNTVNNLLNVTNVLQNRIIKYFIKRGVNFTAPNSVYVDCTVSIEPNATIEDFVSLKGNTYVGVNSKICDGCSLTDANVLDNVIIKNNSSVLQSEVRDNCVIGSNCCIENCSIIGTDSKIGSLSVVNQSVCKENCCIENQCTLINSKLSSAINIGASCKFLGTTANPVKIGQGAIIGSNCTIFDGVYLKNNFSLKNGSTIKKEN